MRTTAVGHFTSERSQERFMRSYRRAMEDLPEPERTLDVRTSFGTVRVYRFAGAHPDLSPLVLLPGRSSASPVWAANLPALLRVRSVYTLDLLGEPGMSVQERSIKSADDQAAWLEELLARLPEARSHLMGVSIGGWMATNLAVRRPERLASLILLDPVFVFAGMSAQAVVRSIPASVRWLPRSWRDSFSSWTAGGVPVKDVPIAAMIEAGMQAYSPKLPAPRQITESQLEQLRVPTLSIIAGRSPMHDPVKVAATARRVLTRGTVKSYADASHAINGEYPQEIADDVRAFVGTIDSKPAH